MESDEALTKKIKTEVSCNEDSEGLISLSSIVSELSPSLIQGTSTPDLANPSVAIGNESIGESTETGLIDISNIKKEKDDEYEGLGSLDNDAVNRNDSTLTQETFTISELSEIVKQEHQDEFASTSQHPHDSLSNFECVICIKCNQYFDNERELERHDNKVHNNRNSFKCQECGKVFAHKAKLLSHNKTHVYQCKICSKIFEGRKSLVSHYTKHNEEKAFQCHICEGSFTYYEYMANHYQQQSIKGIKCVQCNLSFCKAKTLQSHECKGGQDKTAATDTSKEQHQDKSQQQQQHHDQMEQQQNLNECRKQRGRSCKGKFKCQKCGESFAFRFELNCHQEKHGLLYQCSICSKYFMGKETLIPHYATHNEEKAFQCHICEGTFTYDEYISNHYQNKPSKGYKCRHCSLAFCKEKMLQNHEREHQTQLQQEQPQQQVNAQQQQVAQQQIQQQQQLQPRQQQKPDAVKPVYYLFMCRFCGKRYQTKTTCCKPFKCKTCNESFESRRSLIVHRRTHKLLLRCEICDKDNANSSALYSTKKALRKHKSTDHKKVKTLVPCPDCGKEFKTMRLMKIHSVRHNEDQKPRCKVCNKIFLYESSLKKHSYMHHKHHQTQPQQEQPQHELLQLEEVLPMDQQQPQQQVNAQQQQLAQQPKERKQNSRSTQGQTQQRQENNNSSTQQGHQAQQQQNKNNSMSTQQQQQSNNNNTNSTQQIQQQQNNNNRSTQQQQQNNNSSTQQQQTQQRLNQQQTRQTRPQQQQLQFQSMQLIKPTAQQQDKSASVAMTFLRLTVSGRTQYVPVKLSKVNGKDNVYNVQPLNQQAQQQKQQQQQPQSRQQTQQQPQLQPSQQQKPDAVKPVYYLFMCRFCGKRYQTKTTCCKPFNCKTCNESFESRVSLSLHRRTHKLLLRCEICDKDSALYSTKKALMKHKSTYHKKVKTLVPCPDCGKEFKTMRLMKIHSVRHNEDQKPRCKVCNKTFLYESSLKEHSYTHTGVKPYKCTICGRQFTHRMTWVAHVATHNREFKCTHCSRAFTKLERLQNHLHVHDEKACSCTICNKSFRKVADLNRHLKVHDGGKFCCTKCDKKFSKRVLLRWHRQAEHGEVVKKRIECPVCKKVFDRTTNMQRHLSTHTGEKLFKCADCNKRFREKAHLKRHLLAVHFQLRPHECTVCGKRFFKKSGLNSHRAVHEKRENQPVKRKNTTSGTDGKSLGSSNINSKQKSKRRELCASQDYQVDAGNFDSCYCKKCRTWFGEISKFKSHTHDGRFECSDCLKSYVHKTAYKIHKSICKKRFHPPRRTKNEMIKGDDRVYDCPICKKSFPRNHGMLRHYRSHSGAKYFKCSTCDHQYVEKNSLKMHCKVVHLNQAASFDCSYCEKKYFKRSALKRHVLTTHQKGEKDKEAVDDLLDTSKDNGQEAGGTNEAMQSLSPNQQTSCSYEDNSSTRIDDQQSEGVASMQEHLTESRATVSEQHVDLEASLQKRVQMDSSDHELANSFPKDDTQQDSDNKHETPSISKAAARGSENTTWKDSDHQGSKNQQDGSVQIESEKSDKDVEQDTHKESGDVPTMTHQVEKNDSDMTAFTDTSSKDTDKPENDSDMTISTDTSSKDADKSENDSDMTISTDTSSKDADKSLDPEQSNKSLEPEQSNKSLDPEQSNKSTESEQSDKSPDSDDTNVNEQEQGGASAEELTTVQMDTDASVKHGEQKTRKESGNDSTTSQVVENNSDMTISTDNSSKTTEKQQNASKGSKTASKKRGHIYKIDGWDFDSQFCEKCKTYFGDLSMLENHTCIETPPLHKLL